MAKADKPKNTEEEKIAHILGKYRGYILPQPLDNGKKTTRSSFRSFLKKLTNI